MPLPRAVERDADPEAAGQAQKAQDFLIVSVARVLDGGEDPGLSAEPKGGAEVEASEARILLEADPEEVGVCPLSYPQQRRRECAAREARLRRHRSLMSRTPAQLLPHSEKRVGAGAGHDLRVLECVVRNQAEQSGRTPLQGELDASGAGLAQVLVRSDKR